MKLNRDIKVSIVNIGVGNVNSLENAINFLGVDYNLINSKSDLESTSHLILPGVGSFDSLISALEKYDLKLAIKDYIDEGKSFLGICVGMQVLMNGSEEGKLSGLQVFDGYVERLKFKNGKNYFVPNVGFSKIFDFEQNLFFRGLNDASNFYFTHSYGIREIKNKNNLKYNKAYSKHNTNFISAINYKKICGVQFHPEKSQSVGLKILRNFFTL